MDNEVIVKIGDVEFHFKLQSQKIVELEKIFKKNIFEIFADMSFTSMQTVLATCLISPIMDKNELMDILLTKYTAIELANVLVRDIAVKSGLVRQSEDGEIDVKND